MTVRWRTLWRALLWTTFTAGSIISLIGLINGQNTLIQIGTRMLASAVILILFSYVEELRRRVDKLEADYRQAEKLNNTLLRRLVNVMDSARRNDPIYRDRDDRDRATEKFLRDQERR